MILGCRCQVCHKVWYFGNESEKSVNISKTVIHLSTKNLAHTIYDICHQCNNEIAHLIEDKINNNVFKLY